MRPIIIPSSACGLRTNLGLYSCTRRRIHATPQASESAKDKLSAAADRVNKKVGKGLASAIETGEKATEKTKKVLGVTAEHAKETAEGANKGADRVVHKAEEAGNEVASKVKETGHKAQKDL